MYSTALLSEEVESVLDLSNVQIMSLTNPVLMDQTLTLVREERRLGIGIVNRLKEISRRGLYLELGYSSLFTFLVAELKYPEATAYRLVSAMELLKAVPEVEGKIKNGTMSVSTAAQVQSYFKAQGRENSISFNLEEKQEIIKAVESQTTRETERILAGLHPDLPLKPAEEKARPIAKNQTMIQFTASDALMKKLSRIKDLSAHKNWNPSYAELFEMLADAYLKIHDPVIKAERVAKKAECKNAKAAEAKDARFAGAIRDPKLAIVKNTESLPSLEVPAKATTRVILGLCPFKSAPWAAVLGVHVVVQLLLIPLRLDQGSLELNSGDHSLLKSRGDAASKRHVESFCVTPFLESGFSDIVMPSMQTDLARLDPFLNDGIGLEIFKL